MPLSRRQILAAAALAAATECRGQPAAAPDEANPTTPPERAPSADAAVVDAGPLGDYPKDGVYDQFRQQGFFVIRRNKRLFAMSSVCTHKGCKVRAQADQSFFCRCHKSAFDPEGRVLNGPAPRDLPRFAVKLTREQHVLVNPNQPAMRSTETP